MDCALDYMNSRTGLTIKANCKPNSGNRINSAQNRQVDRKSDRQEWMLLYMVKQL